LEASNLFIMLRYSLRCVHVVMVLIIFLYISGCNEQEVNNGKNGFLKGVITIGPLCPVQRIPPDPACLPTEETYKSYPVVVRTADGANKVVQINPELNGSFSVELSAGNYVVALENNQNRIGSSNLPAKVSIISEDTTFLNIDIDTGIR
jgi:hypothetical protein